MCLNCQSFGNVEKYLRVCNRAQSEVIDVEGWRSAAGFRQHPVKTISYAISNNAAAPIPPPIHMLTTTYLTPRLLPSRSAWPVVLAPVMPYGWPIDMAPPLTL